MQLSKKIIFIFIFLIITVTIGLKPRYNWDMLGYMASILRIEESDDKIIHSRVYEIAEEELSGESFSALNNDPFRIALKNDPSAFSQQIPFYSNKTGYVLFSNLIYKLGVPLTYATVLPSLISFFLICIIIFLLLIKVTNNVILGGLITAFIATLTPFINLAKLSSPDAFSTLFLILVAGFFFLKKHYLLLLLSMLLAIFVRPDNIIFCSFLLLSVLVSVKDNKAEIRKTIFGIISIFAVYLGIRLLNDSYSWKVLFYNTFIERQHYPMTLTPDLTLKLYFSTLIQKAGVLVSPMLLFCATALILFRSKLVEKLSDLKLPNLPKSVKLFFVIGLTFITRFLLFPASSMRFYFVYLLIMVIAVAIDHKNLLSISNKTLQPINA